MKTRIEYIDQLKGVAILLVVVGHFIQINTADNTGDALFSAIYSFHMPLFMFISGYVAEKNTSTKIFSNYSKFLQKKATTLLLPFFAWPLIVDQLFFAKPENLKFISIIHGLLVNPTQGLWFLWYLFFLSVLYSIFLLISSRIKETPSLGVDIPVAILLFSFILGIHLLGVVDYTDAFMQYFGFYFIGVFTARYRWLNQLVMTPWIFYILLIIFILSCGQFSFNDPAFHHLNIWLAVKVMISITGIFSLYYITRKISWNPVVNKNICFWGANSLVIYVTHGKMIHILPTEYFLPGLGTFPMILISLLFSIPVIIGCLLMLNIIKLCPPLNLLLYGQTTNSKS
jgi:fucose 4-O-acetylase-like acetyltransferase